jgi:AcrR family transcriptional regulator
MPRQATVERRIELEEALVEYVLEHGIGELSLRPLADALGTSTYSLIYYFGSKEAVVATALRAVNRRLVQLFDEWASSSSPGDLLRRYWAWSSSDDNRPYLKLFSEVYGLSLARRDRFPGFLDADGLDRWVAVVKDLVMRQTGLPAADAERVATVLMSLVTGLQLDLLTSGDRERTTLALEAAATAIDELTDQLRRAAAVA